jgi:hypothetical protein
MYLLSPQPKQGSCAQVTGHAVALDAGEFAMIFRRYGDRLGWWISPESWNLSIANALDTHAADHGPSLRPLTVPTMRRWNEAHQISSSASRLERQERRRGIATRLEGAPPASMDSHQDLLRALNALITAKFGSQRAMCRAWGLGRPSVSAALSDRRSLNIELMDSILRACGVRGTDRQACHDAWRRLARPRQLAPLDRQRADTAKPSTVEGSK